MLGTTICSTMWPSRSGGIPTPISEPSKVTRNRILLLLLPCNPYEVAPPLTMTSDNKGVNTFLGAQQQTLIKLSFMRFREGSFSETHGSKLEASGAGPRVYEGGCWANPPPYRGVW